MSANKVKFGLKNVHYALVTETVATDGSGAITSTYGSLKALAGAVSLSMSSSASKSVFRADNSDYYVSYGYGYSYWSYKKSNSFWTGYYYSSRAYQRSTTKSYGDHRGCRL